MVRKQQTVACEQAGQWISLRLDGELSEFEQAGLDWHLECCAGCRSLAAELTGVAQLLRSAPLVERERESAWAMPTRRRLLIPARRTAFAAVGSAAAATLAFVFLGSSGSHPSRHAFEFRSAAAEIRFVHVHQVRIEPPLAPVVETAPQIHPLRLL